MNHTAIPDTTDAGNDQLARLTGFLYLIFAALGIWSFAYVQPNTIVPGDVAATARQLLDHEFLFRLGKAAGLVNSVLFIVIVLLLYRLLAQRSVFQGKWMVSLVLAAVSIGFVTDSAEFAALSAFKGEYGMDAAQAPVLLRFSAVTAQMLTLFWGLWLFPLGLLVYRSGFLPRLLGVLLAVNGLGYIIHSFTFVLFPAHLSTVLKFIFPLYFSGEIPFILWLLFKGAGWKTVR